MNERVEKIKEIAKLTWSEEEMMWKSLGPFREGSQQRKTWAPLSLRASRRASKTSGGTKFRDMKTLAPLNVCVFSIFFSLGRYGGIGELKQ